MQIKSKKELDFVIQADMMMNRGKFRYTLKDRIKNLFIPDPIMNYLKAMRCVAYYRNKRGGVKRKYYNMRFYSLGVKLGFSVSCDALGYGVVIPHYGTIVIGGYNHIGNYAVLHTSSCITGNEKHIGDALYLSTGAKITSELVLGNNISIGANSVVNKSYEGDNALIAGIPAKYIKDTEAWYIRDHFEDRINKVENLKQKMRL